MVQAFAAHPVSDETAMVAASALPVVGDVVNIAGAIKDPSFSNIAIAAVGLVVPEAGALGRALKVAKESATVAKDAGRAASKIDRAAFAKERRAYWKAESKTNADKYTSGDVARMQKGGAPTGSDGHPMELHHNNRTPEGGVTPMTRTEHRLGDNYKRNHPPIKDKDLP